MNSAIFPGRKDASVGTLIRHVVVTDRSTEPNKDAKRGGPMNKAFAIAAGLFLMQAGDCLAQEQQSFKSLIGRGFEIKSVTFAHGESTENRDTFLVTLQKDKSVAVCFFAAATWINLSNASLEDTHRCDVR
jgi:hypothetical protein